MSAWESIRVKIRNKICIPLTCKDRGRKLNNTDITIISNNCWGGTVYEAHNLKKQSPTVGLFFMAEDYIKFLKHLEEYLTCTLTFIDPMKSRWKKADEVAGDKRFGSYPVGILKYTGGGYSESIEIFFLHYHSTKEAKEKWERRCQRINWNRMLIKFNDQNGCQKRHIEEFDKLPFKNKICFTVKDYGDYDSEVVIKAPKSHKYIRASYEPFGQTKQINITELLNGL